jgi:hypothetical protein
MATYLPEWQIHSESKFEAFHLAPGEDRAMGMVVQAKLNHSGNLTGVFQCFVFCAKPTMIYVTAAKNIPGLPAEFHAMKFAFSVNPEEMAPPQLNSTCTVWKDSLASVLDRTLQTMSWWI